MSRVWNAYESFLLSNASQITAVESSLRSFTYILPGRFKDAELAGEAIYAAVHLLGMYHDSVLFRIVYARSARDAQASNVRAGADVPKMSLHARYTAYWRSLSGKYHRAATALMIVEATQLLAEMLARRRLGKARAWDVVVAIEAIKAALRFSLVRASQRRPVISPPLPQREFDPALLERQRVPGSAATWQGSRTGIIRRSLSTMQGRDAYEHLLSHTLTEQDVSPPPLLVRALSTNIGSAAECLWILRPLVYVLLLRHYGPRDTRPFVTSLLLEWLARAVRKQALLPRGLAAKDMPPPPPSSISLMLTMLGIENSMLDWLASSLSAQPRHPALKPVSAVEGDEWASRDRAFWWYLLRGPVWYQWTRPKIAGFVARTEKRRIIGLLGSIVGEYLPLIDDYYYYSSV
ncbi:peroxisomal membrane protein [Malassezia pachydermatis]|uniref:Peroxisomal membrane protein PEX16 n=1 Tax=Malassezia pachydermatis TaxID=77020 RepID=A0A0M8MXH1_9BASI|nr:hypothetical protein Malapachy_2553 [Malassezia pachydermatis]KOS15531.1 hypothetical protein Malapachy_2553 [Malassezia pachydermatis]